VDRVDNAHVHDVTRDSNNGGALEEGALDVVRVLTGAGHRALWAGGCVRDRVLGIPPTDYDIATDADPEEIVRTFSNAPGADARYVGAAFGVVRVSLGDRAYEVARFRREGDYRDGRHPERVVFSDEREDAERRDFTVNGVFYDPLEDRILDYIGGLEDLERQTIRTIGNADDRFGEDRLRMLRAIRFAARLNWSVEERTLSAIRRSAAAIDAISPERIRDEVMRTIAEGGGAWGLRLLLDTGLLDVVLPEVAAMVDVPQPPQFHPEGDVFTHTQIMLGIASVRTISPELALGILLHDVGKPPTFEVADRIRFNLHTKVGAEIAERICRRLVLSTDASTHVVRLVADHHRFTHVKEMRPSKLKRLLQTPRFQDHLALHRIDCLASHGNLDNYAFCVDALDRLEPDDIKPHRLIRGDDLIALGYAPGPAFGRVLARVEDEQLDGTVDSRTEALALAQKLMASEGCEPQR